MRNVTVALVLDQKKVQDSSFGIVKIRVTFQREKRFFTTGIKVSCIDWQRLDRMKPELDNRIKDEAFIQLYKSLYGHKPNNKVRVEGWIDKARTIIEQLGPNFTFDAFRDNLANYGKEEPQQAAQNDVIQELLVRERTMQDQQRIGTASLYGLVAKSLIRFMATLPDKGRRNFGLPISTKQVPSVPCLSFEQVTPDFLNAYESWMLRAGKASQSDLATAQPASLTTIGIYCRHLRAVFNQAKDKGIITDKTYPFGRNRYVVPAGRNPKKALPKADLDKLKNYQPMPDSSEQRAHDLWIFTYYSNGLNMADLTRLRWRDIDETANSFRFVRQKTKLTRKGDATSVWVALRPETWAIINRHATDRQNPDEYVFPFLKGADTPKRQKDVVAQVVKQTNKWMRRIGETLGIEGSLVTYTARHSFATTLLRNGTSVQMIGQHIGHTQSRSTESYLGDFEEEDRRTYLNML